MLSAELDVNPAGRSLAFSKYAIADPRSWDSVARAWRERVSAQGLETEWQRLYASALQHWQLVFARRQ